MSRTLSNEDVDAIALAVVDLAVRRLTAPPPPVAQESADRTHAFLGHDSEVRPKLSYTAKELCAELSLSRDTIYKLEISGRLKSVPGIRHKIFSRDEVARFLNGELRNYRRK